MNTKLDLLVGAQPNNDRTYSKAAIEKGISVTNFPVYVDISPEFKMELGIVCGQINSMYVTDEEVWGDFVLHTGTPGAALAKTLLDSGEYFVRLAMIGTVGANLDVTDISMVKGYISQ